MITAISVYLACDYSYDTHLHTKTLLITSISISISSSSLHIPIQLDLPGFCTAWRGIDVAKALIVQV